MGEVDWQYQCNAETSAKKESGDDEPDMMMSVCSTMKLEIGLRSFW